MQAGQIIAISQGNAIIVECRMEDSHDSDLVDKPHRYMINVFALDVASLNLNNKSVPALVGFMLNKHVISKA